jgi:hypothetical protein
VIGDHAQPIQARFINRHPAEDPQHPEHFSPGNERLPAKPLDLFRFDPLRPDDPVSPGGKIWGFDRLAARSDEPDFTNPERKAAEGTVDSAEVLLCHVSPFAEKFSV